MKWRLTTFAAMTCAITSGCSDQDSAGYKTNRPIPKKSGPEVANIVSIPQLVSDLESHDGSERISAKAELLRRGKEILPAFEPHGSLKWDVMGSRRIDIVMTLIAGLDTVKMPFYKNSFGLFLGPDITQKQLVEMGQRHGFRLREGTTPRADAFPSIYVDLMEDKHLEQVLKSILVTEPQVLTIRLNFFDAS